MRFANIARPLDVLGWLVTLFALLFYATLSGQAQAAVSTASNQVPAGFPQFLVPGSEKEMQELRDFYWLYYQSSGPLIPLWDEWISMSTLWPAYGPGAAVDQMRERWDAALRSRRMNLEGYIATQQHDGLAHAEGWPFPLWTQAGGIGWHFRGTGVRGYDAPLVKPDGWTLQAAKGEGVNDHGWELELTAPNATAQPPAFDISARSGPWLRLNWWAKGLEHANCYVEWTTRDHPQFGSDRRFYFSPPLSGGELALGRTETRTMIPVYRLATWKGRITGLRLCFANAGPATVVIKSFHTACDTRHPINNLNFIRGSAEYFLWSGDLNFLRDQMGRLREALRFTMREFATREHNCIYTTWPGHEGRSGVRWSADGKKQILPGEGIGGNYWDILPFGGEDALATIYYYDTLLKLASLEEAVAAHPEWGISSADAFSAEALRNHARAVKAYGTKRFWNPQTGRFGTVDLDGVMHDYGWSFLNNEAVYYNFATPEQARSIRDWLSGRRNVAGDTSTGADIYHWRFGPRSSTRRNLDYYFWGWSSPESIPFGNQVQDGGAVLGFSFHDLMCRLKVDGPDDAWKRLQELLAWFHETQAEGGYRAYYAKDPTRGTLQGGNVPGGLGVDKEFFESILVPQVMLYGFLGFQPDIQGFQIHPDLPKTWPELTITRVHWHELVLDLTAKADGSIRLRSDHASLLPMTIELPPGEWQTQAPEARVHGNTITLVLPQGLTTFKPSKGTRSDP